MDDTFNWREESETMTSSLSENWESCYEGISAANEALIAIEELGGQEKSEMLAQLRGEALLCRAYNHFVLVNLFCRHWTQDAAKDLGLPYMDKPETSLRPSYERGNLADFYTKIEKDILDGIALVGDSYYEVPKYHFNQKARMRLPLGSIFILKNGTRLLNTQIKCSGQNRKACFVTGLHL